MKRIYSVKINALLLFLALLPLTVQGQISRTSYFMGDAPVRIKLGPLFAGADFLYLGSNAKSADAYLGISIPLGKKKNSFWI